MAAWLPGMGCSLRPFPRGGCSVRSASSFRGPGVRAWDEPIGRRAPAPTRADDLEDGTCRVIPVGVRLKEMAYVPTWVRGTVCPWHSRSCWGSNTSSGSRRAEAAVWLDAPPALRDCCPEPVRRGACGEKQTAGLLAPLTVGPSAGFRVSRGSSESRVKQEFRIDSFVDEATLAKPATHRAGGGAGRGVGEWLFLCHGNSGLESEQRIRLEPLTTPGLRPSESLLISPNTTFFICEMRLMRPAPEVAERSRMR